MKIVAIAAIALIATTNTACASIMDNICMEDDIRISSTGELTCSTNPEWTHKTYTLSPEGNGKSYHEDYVDRMEQERNNQRIWDKKAFAGVQEKYGDQEVYIPEGATLFIHGNGTVEFK